MKTKTPWFKIKAPKQPPFPFIQKVLSELIKVFLFAI